MDTKTANHDGLNAEQKLQNKSGGTVYQGLYTYAKLLTIRLNKIAIKTYHVYTKHAHILQMSLLQTFLSLYS